MRNTVELVELVKFLFYFCFIKQWHFGVKSRIPQTMSKKYVSGQMRPKVA